MTGRRIKLTVLTLALLGLGLALAGCSGPYEEPTEAPYEEPAVAPEPVLVEEEAVAVWPETEEGMVAILVIDGFGPVVEAQEEAEPVEEGAPAAPLEYAGSDWGVAQVQEGVLDEIKAQNLSDRLQVLDGLLELVVVPNCLATPSGQPHISAIGTRAYGADGVTKDFVDEPHGLLVYSELEELLDAQEWVLNTNTIRNGFSLFAAEEGGENAEAASFSPWLRTMELWQKGGQQLALVGIDTDGFTTESAAQRIKQTVDLLEDGDRVDTLYEAWGAEPVASAFEGFVLNMSFVLVPCDPGLGAGLDDFEIRGLYEDMLNTWAPIEQIGEEQFTQISGVLENLTPDLVDAPVLDNARIEVEEWQYTQARMVLAYLGTGYDMDSFRENTLFNHADPLFQVLQGYRESGTDGGAPVISVAAAGNSQVGFPFAPALWDSVISVSAQGAAYSNSGEVALEGNHTSQDAPKTGERLQGTSFAAPRLSVKAANYLLAGGSVPCQNPNVDGPPLSPPLAYVDMPDEDEGGYLFSSAWQNMSLEEAAGQFCPGFAGASPFPAMPGGYLEAALAGEYAGTEVVVDGPFTDVDEVLFNESMKAFEDATGINVNYIGSKEFEGSISIRVDAGDAPDIADFPQPGLLAGFVRQGRIVDPTTWMSEDWLRQQYNRSWLDMGYMGGQTAGVWHRFNGKSLVWYPKDDFDAAGYEIPRTWDELIDLMDMIVADGDTPWCIGIESGAATGWPATDWMEEFMLRTTSLENYDKWTTGELPFASAEVWNAAETLAKIWFNDDYVYGGTASIVSTFFGDSPAPMFEDPPKCWMHKQGNFITGFFPEGSEAGVDYDFFYLPGIDEAYGKPFLVAGDIMAMFNDRPEVRALMEYFTTPNSASGWLENGGALAAHQTATPDMYGAKMERGIAELVQEATSFRFDGSDLMPGEVGAGSFWKGMTDWVSGAADLDTVLWEIDDSWPW